MNREDKLWIEEQVLLFSRALNGINKPIPVLFQDHCEKCGKETTHRSYIGEKPPLREDFYAAMTRMIDIPGYEHYNLLKICLACGGRVYPPKDNDNNKA